MDSINISSLMLEVHRNTEKDTERGKFHSWTEGINQYSLGPLHAENEMIVSIPI